jgi:predicted N-acetyltransferase YhbS
MRALVSRYASRSAGAPTSRIAGMKDITLRLAMHDDAADIVSVIRRAFAQYDGKLVPPSGALHETEATVAARIDTERCIVAFDGASPIACIFYKRVGDQLYFSRLAVLPDRRGEGLAQRLVAEVEAAARTAGLAAVTLGVRIALPGNVAMFAALGYREIGRKAHSGFSEPTSITMEKRLGE